jgi:hypothetical protein
VFVGDHDSRGALRRRFGSFLGGLEIEFDMFHRLGVDAERIAIGTSARRELATRGRDRVPIPDLWIGVCARRHQAAVLYVDRDYGTLAGVLAFTPVRSLAEIARTRGARPCPSWGAVATRAAGEFQTDWGQQRAVGVSYRVARAAAHAGLPLLLPEGVAQS